MNQSIWPYYNEDEAGHTKGFAYRDYVVDAATIANEWNKNLIDGLSVTMYWTSEVGAAADSSQLYVIVTAKRGGQKSTITSTYELEITPKTGTEDKWQWKMNWRE